MKRCRSRKRESGGETEPELFQAAPLFILLMHVTCIEASNSHNGSNRCFPEQENINVLKNVARTGEVILHLCIQDLPK